LEDVNFPELFEPNTENFFSTFPDPHPGQLTAAAAPTSFSNSRPQRRQRNSKIGTAPPSPPGSA
jgi:hypothetical protein